MDFVCLFFVLFLGFGFSSNCVAHCFHYRRARTLVSVARTRVAETDAVLDFTFLNGQYSKHRRTDGQMHTCVATIAFPPFGLCFSPTKKFVNVFTFAKRDNTHTHTHTHTHTRHNRTPRSQQRKLHKSFFLPSPNKTPIRSEDLFSLFYSIPRPVDGR